VNERTTTCVARPAVALSLQPLGEMLNVHDSVPWRKGYIYLAAIKWRSAVPYCGQWVVLCEAVPYCGH